MPRFHDLTVADVRKTIRDAVVVTLRPADGSDLDFIPGQYLTFLHEIDGTELRRCYSICSGPGEPLQVGIKKVDGGAFSTWANEQLRPGMVIQAMDPMGQFQLPADAAGGRTYLGFAGGSGITPVLSILKTVLATEPNSRFTLVYANRGVNTIMFREELEDLKNLHIGRLNVIHVLESGVDDIELFQGRVDQQKCAALFSGWIDIRATDMAFICGPEPMMLGIAASLRDHGLTDDQIRFELFSSDQPGRLARRSATAHAGTEKRATRTTITVDGATATFDMSRDQSILDAALANTLDAPHACKAGVCSTCKCRVLEGEVEMAANHALQDDEVARGYVLSCQSYPLTDRVVVEYEDH